MFVRACATLQLAIRMHREIGVESFTLDHRALNRSTTMREMACACDANHHFNTSRTSYITSTFAI